MDVSIYLANLITDNHRGCLPAPAYYEPIVNPIFRI